MRLFDLMRFGMRYIIAGCVAAVVVIIAFIIGYKLIYQKCMHGTKKIGVPKTIWLVVFVIYSVVLVGATFLSRGEYYGAAQIVPPFASYKEAWYQGKASNVRNIIINVLLFVPLGVLLPIGIKKMRTCWKTYVVGFAVTIFIEVFQLITKRGIFEFDDIFNNLIGTMIGYGLFMIGVWLFTREEKKKQALKMVISLIPLVLSTLTMIIVCMVYEKQELGNLSVHYITRVPESKFEIQSNLNLNAQESKAYVYEVREYSLVETREIADNILSQAGTVINDNSTDVYDNTVFYYGDRIHISIDYKGGFYDYTNFESTFSNGKLVEKEDATQEEVTAALNELGVDIPDGAIFENGGNGRYIFNVDAVEIDGLIYDGHLSCTMMSDDSIARISNKIYVCTAYKEYDVISEEQAYGQVLDGKFQLNYPVSGKCVINIKDVHLGYILDSKTYYQPVYMFDTLIDGNEYQIQIPAVK